MPKKITIKEKTPSIQVVDKEVYQQLTLYYQNIIKDDIYRRMSQQ